MADAASNLDQAPLEDLMVAMDVVDTIRHRHLLIDRELNADARRDDLRRRLRDIYDAQGIEVTDDAIDSGIAALEEERFRYTPVQGGFSVWLAKIYVSRHQWGKRVRVVGLLAALIFAVWFFGTYMPDRRMREELPQSIEAFYAEIVSSTNEQSALTQARQLIDSANAALNKESYDTAAHTRNQLQALLQQLKQTYQVRIVSRPNELSGVWRVPNVNETARNYYLIVEAITPTGNQLSIPISSEEDGSSQLVEKWGVRVSAETFESVSADKLDDGIIQNNVIGLKVSGQLTPEYQIPISGGTITQW